MSRIRLKYESEDTVLYQINIILYIFRQCFNSSLGQIIGR